MKLQQAGTFRGEITGYQLETAESGAKAIRITVAISEVWEKDDQTGEHAWFDWSDYKLEAEGYLWVVKKDGTINDRTVRSLVECAGWDGDFISISDGTWNPLPIQIVVGEDKYKGESRYRIEWVNPHGSTPGRGGGMSSEEAAKLQRQLGSQMRALVGSIKRNAEPPAQAKAKK